MSLERSSIVIPVGAGWVRLSQCMGRCNRVGKFGYQQLLSYLVWIVGGSMGQGQVRAPLKVCEMVLNGAKRVR